MIKESNMKKFFAVVAVICFCILSLTILAEGVSPELIQLSEPADIHDAQRLNNEIDLLAEKVGQCTEQNLAEYKECFCLYPTELARVKIVYDSLLQEHPDWQDKTIFWWRDEGMDYSYNISMKSLELQLEKKCN
jgi:hypothetical protein